MIGKRRFGNFTSRSSSKDRDMKEDNRRAYSGRGSDSYRPEPEARREYDEQPPLNLSRFGEDLPPSESLLMKFEWNNLLAHKRDFLAEPEVGDRNGGDSYRINTEKCYGRGGGQSGLSGLGVDPTKQYRHFDCGFTSPLGMSHVGVQKNEGFRHGDHRPFPAPGQDGKPVFRSGAWGSKEGFGGFSVELNRSSREMVAGPFGLGGYSQGQKSENNGGDLSALPVVDLLYTKMASSGVERPKPPPPVGYLRPIMVDSIVDKVSGINDSIRVATEQSSQWDQYHYNLREQTQNMPSYQSLNEKQSFLGYDGVLGSCSRTRSFGLGGDYGIERGVELEPFEPLSYKGTLRRLALLERDQGLYDMTTLEMCRMRKLALEKKLSGDDSNYNLLNDLNASSIVPTSSYGEIQFTSEDIERYRTIGEGQWNIDQDATYGEGQWNIDQDVTCGEGQCFIDQGVTGGEDQWRNINQDVAYGGDQWNGEDIKKINSDILLPSSELPASMQEHFGEQFKSARGDVKKRLGTLKSPGSVKNRLGTLKSPGTAKKHLGTLKSPGSVKRRLEPLKSSGSIKERLGPLTSSDNIKKPLGPAQKATDLKILSCKLPEQLKSRMKKPDHFSGSVSIHPQWDGLPNFKAKAAKNKPPEDSEEFKQLVDNAFLKYIKLLNENPSQRRKFMEGGKFIIKCCACASNSKEFAGTLPLVMHSFMSHMVGLRAEHLGFHKALCMLLGWDSTAVLNNTWVQRNLPDAEALAMKEDLVIWPPVVVIHNSSIANKKPDERLIVSIEGLEAILGGIGFSVGKSKVCRGKPANQSIMVVTFNATFSSLREAERLHKFFSDNKHGRAEFKQITSGGLSNKADCLYGYLGIAEDLDKLDFETKKRCVVKSKKEIQAIAYAYS